MILKVDYLAPSQVIPALFWMVVLLVVSHVYRSGKSNNPAYKYFLANIYYKLGASLAFASFYALYVGGGDSTAFYDGAVALNNLLLENPDGYFHQMANTSDWSYYTVDFNSRTGYPPSWIYREPEGYFICKLLSLFTLITFKSYFAGTLIISFVTALVSYQLYRLVRAMELFDKRYLAFAILFIPSLNFWCTGVSKDAIVLISLLGITYHAFRLILPDYKNKPINWLMIIVYIYLISHIRPFILIPIGLPLAYALSARLLKRIGLSNAGVSIIRTVLLIVLMAVAGGTAFNQSEEELLENNSLIQQAQVIQQDFQYNDTYGEKKYDLGQVEFTGIGLLRVMPRAMLYGVFAPFIWNALNVTLILNGLESMLFIYLVFAFMRKSPFRKIAFIRSNEFLTFSLILVVILSYLTGLTSGLYGVLVRVRAPLLIFFTLVLIIDWSKVDLQKKVTKRKRTIKWDERQGFRTLPNLGTDNDDDDENDDDAQRDD